MKVCIKDKKELQETILINGYSLRSFADELDLSHGYLSQVVNGKRNPSGKVAKKIAEHFKRDFQHFFYIDSGNNCERSDGSL